MRLASWSWLIPTLFFCAAFLAAILVEARRKVRWKKRRNAMRRWLRDETPEVELSNVANM